MTTTDRNLVLSVQIDYHVDKIYNYYVLKKEN